jgi:uncharacterized protein YceK
MKTILMLIVGLMLAGCGSMENHVRNHGVASTRLPDPGDTIAVDTICLPLTINSGHSQKRASRQRFFFTGSR